MTGTRRKPPWRSVIARTGRPPKHPWDQWFGAARSAPLELRWGVDFDCSPRAFQSQARAAAGARGLVVTTATDRRSVLLRCRERAAHYPWDDWLDGQTHVLTFGRDFHVPVEDMRRAVRRAARRRGLGIESKRRDDRLKIRAVRHSNTLEP